MQGPLDQRGRGQAGEVDAGAAQAFARNIGDGHADKLPRGAARRVRRRDAGEQRLADRAHEHLGVVGAVLVVRRAADRQPAAGQKIIKDHGARLLDAGLVVDQVVDVMRLDTGAACKLANLAVDRGARAGRRFMRARAGARGRVGATPARKKPRADAT